MLFHFYPWTLDVDVEATKQLYIENDYSTDKSVNTRFIRGLTDKQKNFFRSVGAEPIKFKTEEKVFDLSGEGSRKQKQIVCRTSVHFLICGKFLAIPDFQKELYGDDDLFGKEFPVNLEIVHMQEEEFPAYDIDGLGMGIIFKHPCTQFDEPKFQKWDCGYILASIWIAKDL